MALPAPAAVLQGFVLDAESGRALARTSVTLTPLPGASGLTAQALRTESNGSFFFGAAPGAYLLTLQREGFAVATHHQARLIGFAVAIEVAGHDEIARGIGLAPPAIFRAAQFGRARRTPRLRARVLFLCSHGRTRERQQQQHPDDTLHDRGP